MTGHHKWKMTCMPAAERHTSVVQYISNSVDVCACSTWHIMRMHIPSYSNETEIQLLSHTAAIAIWFVDVVCILLQMVHVL